MSATAVRQGAPATALVPIAVDTAALLREPAPELVPILARLPAWHEASIQTITAERLTGGCTNLIYRCRLTTTTTTTTAQTAAAQAAPAEVVVRVHQDTAGSLYDRDYELHACLAAAAAGTGPRALLLFQNGRVEEFLKASPLTSDQMRDGAISARVAQSLAAFHLGMQASLAPAAHADLRPGGLWQRIRTWLRCAQEAWADDEAVLRTLDACTQAADRLEQELTQVHPCWEAICHNDLQHGNILLHSGGGGAGGGAAAGSRASGDGEAGSPDVGPPSCTQASDSATAAVFLIDYDYVLPGPVAFDIANHFCEWCADYTTATPAALDYARFPSTEQQQAFIASYLAALLDAPDGDTAAAGGDPDALSAPDAAGAGDGAGSSSSVAGERTDAAAATTSTSTSGRPPAGVSRGTTFQCWAEEVSKTWDATRLGRHAPAPHVGAAAPAAPGGRGNVPAGLVMALYDSCVSYVAVSHLHWAAWALVMCKSSCLPGFDYRWYAEQRLRRLLGEQAGL